MEWGEREHGWGEQWRKAAWKHHPPYSSAFLSISPLTSQIPHLVSTNFEFFCHGSNGGKRRDSHIQKKSSCDCWISLISCNGIWEKINLKHFSRNRLGWCYCVQRSTASEESSATCQGCKRDSGPSLLFVLAVKGLPSLWLWTFVL